MATGLASSFCRRNAMISKQLSANNDQGPQKLSFTLLFIFIFNVSSTVAKILK